MMSTGIRREVGPFASHRLPTLVHASAHRRLDRVTDGRNICTVMVTHDLEVHTFRRGVNLAVVYRRGSISRLGLARTRRCSTHSQVPCGQAPATMLAAIASNPGKGFVAGHRDGGAGSGRFSIGNLDDPSAPRAVPAPVSVYLKAELTRY